MTATALDHPPASVVVPAPLKSALIGLMVGADTLKDFSIVSNFRVVDILGDLVRKLREDRLLPEGPTAYALVDMDGSPLNPLLSLDDQGVTNGTMLALMPEETVQRFLGVCEDIHVAIATASEANRKRADVTTWRALANGLAITASAVVALLLIFLWWRTHGWIPAATGWGLAVAAAWLAKRTRWVDILGFSALVVAAAAAGMSVPTPLGTYHLVAVGGVVLIGVAIMTAVTGRYVTACCALLVAGGAGSVAAEIIASGWRVTPERIGLTYLFMSLILVTGAPSIGLRGSGVPGPWFPSIVNRGLYEPVDKDTIMPIRQSPLPTIEDVVAWQRRATQITTGLLVGVAVVMPVAAWFTCAPYTAGGWAWTAFALGVCWAVGLRARVFADRIPAIIPVVAGTVTAMAVIGRYAVASGPATIPTLVCVGLMLTLAALVCLLVVGLSRVKVSAPINKAIELSEYVPFLILAGPWWLWLSGLLLVLRNIAH